MKRDAKDCGVYCGQHVTFLLNGMAKHMPNERLEKDLRPCLLRSRGLAFHPEL